MQGATDLTEEEIRTVVVSAGEKIESTYFDADVGMQVQEKLQSELAAGRFKGVTTNSELANAMTRVFDEVTSDGHLVAYFQPESEVKVDRNGQDLSRIERGRRSNFGFQRAEILQGNVGYLNITSFFRVGEAEHALAAAMGMLSNADALIIDMRFNMGGSPGTVSLLMSYLFEDAEPRLLFDVVPRDAEARSYLTNVSVDHRNASRPVYVLTDSTTFSAGEGLAFLLKDQKRGVVIGERTAGAANPGRPFRIHKNFEVNIPTGMIQAAHGKNNWEGTGVEPDVDSKGRDALQMAHYAALKKLIETAKSDRDVKQLEELLSELESLVEKTD